MWTRVRLLRPEGDGGAGGGSAVSGAERIPRDVAARIRLVILDVDGVLTDAGVYLGEDSEGRPVELKRFDIQDGLGLVLLREAGIRLALVSGRVSPATAARARELGIEECHQEAGARKLPVVRGILERHGLAWDETAMLGDDLPDLPVFRRVGLPVAVSNAVSEVRREALWTTRREGGRGAVREFSKVLLQSRGEWEKRVDAYLAARDGDQFAASTATGGRRD
ncbi:MAG: HAD-IIIA family hydrolase [Gemmatimonadales bacterium]|nr:MAG: HAD-IIIA family hydrolase [Gemmatimonadales bacterium]